MLVYSIKCFHKNWLKKEKSLCKRFRWSGNWGRKLPTWLNNNNAMRTLDFRVPVNWLSFLQRFLSKLVHASHSHITVLFVPIHSLQCQPSLAVVLLLLISLIVFKHDFWLDTAYMCWICLWYYMSMCFKLIWICWATPGTIIKAEESNKACYRALLFLCPFVCEREGQMSFKTKWSFLLSKCSNI